jgi:hypothetical protein
MFRTINHRNRLKMIPSKYSKKKEISSRRSLLSVTTIANIAISSRMKESDSFTNFLMAKSG